MTTCRVARNSQPNLKVFSLLRDAFHRQGAPLFRPLWERRKSFETFPQTHFDCGSRRWFGNVGRPFDSISKAPSLTLVGGLGISYRRGKEGGRVCPAAQGCAVLVVCDLSEHRSAVQILWEDCLWVDLQLRVKGKPNQFQDTPYAMALLRRLREVRPDLIPGVLFAVQDFLSPILTSANSSHAEAFGEVSVVGMCKKPFFVDGLNMQSIEEQLAQADGQRHHAVLKGRSGTVWGAAVLSKPSRPVHKQPATKPLFVSLVYGLELEVAINIVQRCCQSTRMPEPLFRASVASRNRVFEFERDCHQLELDEQQPYFQFCANSGIARVDEARASVLSIDDPSDFARQISLLTSIHAKHRPVHYFDDQERARLVGEAESAGAQHHSFRHRIQAASIVENMCRLGMLSNVSTADSRVVCVEFGAGRGSLSLAVRQVMPTIAMLLVDRRNPSARKADVVLREGLEDSFQRVRCDIRHFNLARAPLVARPRSVEQMEEARDSSSFGNSVSRLCPVIAMSKHLCGVATDLALRCLWNAMGSNFVDVRGVAIALCCHQLCKWEDYIGQQYFQHTLGLGRLDFEIMCRASSWAVDGRGPLLGLSCLERQRVGRNCKLLIDTGRLDFLRKSMGMQADVVEYCDEDTSPENSLLLAWPR